MNFQQRPIRTVVAIGAAVTLTLAACGGDDDASADTATAETADSSPESAGGTSAETGSAEAPAMEPASVTFDAQESDGTTITVASVELPSPGFIAVHADGGGSPGPVIGHSDLLPAGTSSDVAITLDEPLAGDTALFPMAHIDTDGNGLYEFGAVEGVDGPALTAEGDVAVVTAEVTVTGSATGDASGDTASADDATITIADFAFDGVTEIPVGTTVVVTNEDSTAHTWTAVDGEFDSGALNPGDTFEFTFTEPGEFAYFCNFHPSMEGTITVTG